MPLHRVGAGTRSFLSMRARTTVERLLADDRAHPPGGRGSERAAMNTKWRLCLGPYSHWVEGELEDGSCLPGREYRSDCGERVIVIGFGGSDPVCPQCRRLHPGGVLPKRVPGAALSRLRRSLAHGW